VTPFLRPKDTRCDSCEVVEGGTVREESRFERSVTAGGAQVEDQIAEIAVDWGIEVGATSGEEKEPIVSRQNTAAERLEGCWNLELATFRRLPEIYS
jgi:hypothetical protein